MSWSHIIWVVLCLFSNVLAECPMCVSRYTQCNIESSQFPCLCLRNYSFCLHWDPECPETDKSNLPAVCQASNCTITQGNCSDIKIPNYNCATCGIQYNFCLDDTYENATILMSPIYRKCFCLSRLEDCLDQLSCSDPAFLKDTCSEWGSICAKNQTNGTFLCEDQSYNYSPPTSKIIREIIEDRTDEFQDYWSKRVMGLLQVKIQNCKDDSSQLSTIDFSYEYEPQFVNSVLEKLGESIADDLSISLSRISVIGTNTSKRNILASQNATIIIYNISSALPLLTSWWSFLLLIYLLLLSL